MSIIKKQYIKYIYSSDEPRACIRIVYLFGISTILEYVISMCDLNLISQVTSVIHEYIILRSGAYIIIHNMQINK